MLAPIAALSLIAALSGCGVAVTAVSFAASGVSYALTDKSPSDNALSYVADRDCALFNFVKGKPICHDKPAPVQVASLAAISPAAGDATVEQPPAPYRVLEGSTLMIDHLAAGKVELVGFAAHEEFFALVQDDGALEVFVHDPSAHEDPANIRLVMRVDRYATDPGALEGIIVGDVFLHIKDIIV